jgi:hypothetical protein
MTDAETESFTGHGVSWGSVLPMESKLREWQLDVERIWSSDAPDWREAARLADVMARISGEAILRQAAAQALPILRSAAAGDAATLLAARRRLGIIAEALIGLSMPQFGRRETSPKQLTPEERYRQMLGLPLDGRLSAPEIHQAWKRAAKAAHPDAGGSVQQFQGLSVARDALIRGVRLERRL